MIPNHNIRLFFSENGEVAVPQNGSYATNSNQQLFVSYILKYNLKKNKNFMSTKSSTWTNTSTFERKLKKTQNV